LITFMPIAIKFVSHSKQAALVPISVIILMVSMLFQVRQIVALSLAMSNQRQ
jgi:hypothetical protein